MRGACKEPWGAQYYVFPSLVELGSEFVAAARSALLDRQMDKEEIVKNTFVLSLLAAGLLFCAAGIANAQNVTTPQQSATSYASLQHDYEAEAPAEQTSSNVRTLAGCLTKGSTVNEYTLRGEGLTWWQLTSDSVYLAGYVDKIIRVTVVNSPDRYGIYYVTQVSAVIGTDCVR